MLWAGSLLVAALSWVSKQEALASWVAARLGVRALPYVTAAGAAYVIWAAMYFGHEMWVRAAGIYATESWVKGHDGILRHTAGNLEEIVHCIRQGDRRISESDAKRIVTSFLARVVDYADLFINARDVHVRACCYVVREGQYDVASGKLETFLELWAYNAPDTQRRRERIRLGEPLAGQVAQQLEPLVIHDISHSDVAQYFEGPRRYKTVLGLPIVANEKLYGVVTVDATEAGVFQLRGIGSALDRAVSPVLASIALTLDALG